MRFLLRLVLFAGWLGVGLAAGVAHAAPEKIALRAWPHPDFVRLVFDWPVPVDYSVARDDRVLTVRFDRELTADFAQIRANVATYVRSAAIGDDGRSVRLQLAAPYEFRHFMLNGSVVVDLMDQAVGAAATTSPAVGRVGVRVGSHPRFTRIVFDWPGFVDYAIDRSGDVVVAQFTRPATFDLSRVQAGLPRGLASIVAQPVDNGAAVQIGLSGGVRIRHFRDGFKVVLDVLMPQTAQQAVPDAAPVTAVATQSTTPPPAAAPATAAPATAAPVPLATAPAIAAAPTAPTAAGRLVVQPRPDDDAVQLAFPFARPVAAAVFRRGGLLWLVFDDPVNVDFSALSAAGDAIASAVQLDHPDATVLRLATAPGLNPILSRSGTTWIVTLRPALLKPTAPLEVNVVPDGIGGQRVVLPVTSIGDPLIVRDPEVGDTVMILPTVLLGHGVAGERRYVEFRLLPTAQGVVVVAGADRLQVDSRGDSVVISGAGGLRVTATADRGRLAGTALTADTVPRLFAFDRWRRTEIGDFDSAKQVLLTRVATRAGDERNLARLELARFYFAYAYPERVLGALDAVARDAPGLVRDRAFISLRGAARYLMGDIEGAGADLMDRSLNDQAEALIWRAAVAAADGDWPAAAAGYRLARPFIALYPDLMRRRLSLLGAEIALQVGAPVEAQEWLDALDNDALTTAERSQIALLEGRIAQAAGDDQAAVAKFDLAIESGDYRAVPFATLERAELQLANNELEPEDMIEVLDRLRYLWRGDDFELGVLRRLGEIYMEAGDYRAGFQTLKRAAAAFPEHAGAGELTEGMQARFRDLYLEGEADALPAVSAIALFNEFRELTPLDASGDEMIRRLADRLVAVDLLEQADTLLDHQIEFRLKDAVERAEVGTRLAIIRLLNHRPDEALRAMDDTATTFISPALASERRLLAARAHAELGDTAQSLRTLEDDSSVEADKLRTEILWQAQDWRRVADVLERLVGPPPGPNGSLAGDRTRYALNLAIALSLDGDRARLAAMRRAYGPAMASSQYAHDFRIIAADESNTTDLDELLERAAEVDDFQAFMAGYRERLAATRSTPLVN